MDWRDGVLLAPRYLGDWRDSVLSASRYPVDWWDSVISAPQVPWGLTLTVESLRSQDLYWYSDEVCISYKSWNFKQYLLRNIYIMIS